MTTRNRFRDRVYFDRGQRPLVTGAVYRTAALGGKSQRSTG